MAHFIVLKNRRTNEEKSVKIGFSWTLFLFSTCFGIPLFMRKLHVWGFVILALHIFYLVISLIPASGDSDVSMAKGVFNVMLYCILSIFSIVFGIKGNEMTVKNYLENGWIFADPNSKPALFLQLKWAMG